MLLALLLGCIAVPLLTPPARVSLVGGPSFPVEESHERPGEPVQVTGEARIGVQPLGLFPSLADRPLDLTGGLVLHLDEGLARPGAYAEGSVYLWNQTWSNQSRARLRAFGALDMLPPELRAPEWDPGLRGGVGIDWGGFVHGMPGVGVGRDGSWVGVSYGEWAVGLVAEGGYQRLPDADLFCVALGVEFQLPATAGFLLLPVHR